VDDYVTYLVEGIFKVTGTWQSPTPAKQMVISRKRYEVKAWLADRVQEVIYGTAYQISAFPVILILE